MSKANYTKTSKPNTSSPNCKIWVIISVAIVGVLLIVTTVLATVLVLRGNDGALQPEPEPTADVKTDDYSTPPSPEPSAVDISNLDKLKLVTEVDLEAGEIPDHYRGNKNAKVIVIEYEDFACSHCQELHQYAEQIHADYQDRVLFIHRSFNLGFPNSDRTLLAAEAAYQLGGEEAYWAMAKLLYQDTKWIGNAIFGSQGILNSYAKQIGLDSDKFQEAMSNVVGVNKITRDKELGVAAGVTGTPSWFINGQQVTPRDADIRAAINAALE
jgi:protein-disulfide isomerase